MLLLNLPGRRPALYFPFGDTVPARGSVVDHTNFTSSKISPFEPKAWADKLIYSQGSTTTIPGFILIESIGITGSSWDSVISTEAEAINLFCCSSIPVSKALVLLGVLVVEHAKPTATTKAITMTRAVRVCVTR